MNRYVELQFKQIEARYNPDHDMPDGIQVSWVEYALLKAVEELEDRVIELEKRIQQLSEWQEAREVSQ